MQIMEKTLRCPFCKSEGPDYVHIIGVEILKGSDSCSSEPHKAILIDADLNTYKTNDHIRIGDNNRKRELDVIMRCMCELGGHVFEIRNLFHKGNVYLDSKLISSKPSPLHYKIGFID